MGTLALVTRISARTNARSRTGPGGSDRPWADDQATAHTRRTRPSDRASIHRLRIVIPPCVVCCYCIHAQGNPVSRFWPGSIDLAWYARLTAHLARERPVKHRARFGLRVLGGVLLAWVATYGGSAVEPNPEVEALKKMVA